MTNTVRSLLGAGVLSAFLACGCSSPSLPAITVPSPAFIVGTGPNDLWWLNAEPGSDPQRPDQVLTHLADGTERKTILDGELREVRTVAPAEPGTIWVVSSPEPQRLVVRKLDASGNVLVDRSEDFEILAAGFSYGTSMRAVSHDGVVALLV